MKKKCETTEASFRRIFHVERLLTAIKRDGISKIDMHETPCGISSGLIENIIKTKMHVRTTGTVILTCYNSIIKQ